MAFKSTSLIQAFGGTAALVAAAAMPMAALAADAPSTAHTHAVDATSNLVVVIDAVTGELRAPTAAELKASAERAPAARGAVARTMPKVHTSGARGARLTDEFMHYSVSVRQADGSFREVCYHSKEEAEAAAKAPASITQNALPTE